MSNTNKNIASNDIELQLKEAFEGVHAPAALKTQTMQAIEDARKDELATGRTSNQSTAKARRKNINIVRVSAIVTSIAACAIVAFVGLGALFNGANKPAAPEQTQSQVSQPAQPETSPATTPLAFVGIDINPSLEFEVSAEGDVIAVDAINADAANAIAGLPLENQPYKEALSAVLNSPGFAPYITQTALLEVNVASDDTALSDRLTAITNEVLAPLHRETMCLQTDMAHHAEASSNGMGMGKYRAATELIQNDPSLTLNDCKNMSMSEIHDRNGAHNSGSGHGSGHGATAGAQQSYSQSSAGQSGASTAAGSQSGNQNYPGHNNGHNSGNSGKGHNNGHE